MSCSDERRASVRSWLHRIATNVCFDMLRSAQRRAVAIDVATPVCDPCRDPSDTASARERIRLAFVAALLHLPARQRAVLILRDVLRWRATEVAALLDTSVTAVNSALQRARETLAARDLDAICAASLDAAQRAYVEHAPPPSRTTTWRRW